MRPAGIFFVGQAASRPRRCDPNRAETGGGLVVLDPSSEIALMMIAHRRKADRKVIVLDPRWIGRFGGTKEEDIAVVTKVMTGQPRHTFGVGRLLSRLRTSAFYRHRVDLGFERAPVLQPHFPADLVWQRMGHPKLGGLASMGKP